MFKTWVIIASCAWCGIFFVNYHIKRGDEVTTSQQTRSLLPAAIERESYQSANACDNSVWCSVKPPSKSLFRFPDAPTDAKRWLVAQQQAARGDPILIRKIIKHFPHYFDFLDGDTQFRIYHQPADFFLDSNNGFDMMYKDPSYIPEKNAFGGDLVKYKWYNAQYPVLPVRYNLADIDRAPLVHVGYFAFSREGGSSGSSFFMGNFIDEAVLDRRKFLRLWQRGKQLNAITHPWIGLHAANENWGLLSTFLPNRSANWGGCCWEKPDQTVFHMLNDNMTLLFMVNQHYNLTHPKLLSLPRGMPIHGDHSRRIVWDSMHQLCTLNKEQLIFTASSNWGYRPKLLQCLARKFTTQEAQFTFHNERKAVRLTPLQYYDKLGRSMFSIALPGLGYDTFRLWEALTVGTIPIVERGIGLDKTLWRLPALLVDDYDQVTPELLRTAYVEALYRAEAGQFEFERLTQSFWWSFIANVSVAQSTEAVFAKFPPEADAIDFMRPLERFDCHEKGGCGPGTKKIAASIC